MAFLLASVLLCGAASQVIISHPHTELGKVSAISRFRSGEGHDYSTAPDSCCSMKHYFEFGFWDWSQVQMFAPCDGVVTYWSPEQLPNSGYQLGISSKLFPELQVSMFHLAGNASSFKQGMTLTAGQYLANHTGSITDSDIAIRNLTSNTLLSYFDLIDSSVQSQFSAHCIKDSSMMIISAEDRKQYPLSPCPGGALNPSAPHVWPDWVMLC